MAAAATGPPEIRPLDFLGMILPNVNEAFDHGILPRELAADIGKLGLFGMHFKGHVHDLALGSERQREEWLSRMAAGDAIGCIGLAEPDAGSDPGSMRTRMKDEGRLRTEQVSMRHVLTRAELTGDNRESQALERMLSKKRSAKPRRQHRPSPGGASDARAGRPAHVPTATGLLR